MAAVEVGGEVEAAACVRRAQAAAGVADCRVGPGSTAAAVAVAEARRAAVAATRVAARRNNRREGGGDRGVWGGVGEGRVCARLL